MNVDNTKLIKLAVNPNKSIYFSTINNEVSFLLNRDRLVLDPGLDKTWPKTPLKDQSGLITHMMRMQICALIGQVPPASFVLQKGNKTLGSHKILGFSQNLGSV